MDAACQRALEVAGKSASHRRHIEGILKRGIKRAAPANGTTIPELCRSSTNHMTGPTHVAWLGFLIGSP